MANNVKYTRKGDIHTINLGVAGLEEIVIDYTNIPEDQRTGAAKALLSAAALSCYVSALGVALDARGADFDSIESEITIELGANSVGQGRVLGLNIDTTVNMAEADKDIFERCIKIMKQGCLVTGSLHEGMKMDYNLTSNFVK